MAAGNVSMVSLPPVSKEQAFLETYFTCLSQFAYDKAKELSEKEKDSHKANIGSSWNTIVTALVQLAIAEKHYASLMFLGMKWFGRTYNLRMQYGMLLTEFKKIEHVEEMSHKSDLHSGVNDPVLDKLLGHLCGQLAHFLTARSKMMDFYEQMAAMGSMKQIRYDDLRIIIVDIIQAHHRNFHHPILSPLKSSFTYECDVIHHLLLSQQQLCHWQFMPALLHLNDAHSKLSSWSGCLPSRESFKKLTFGGGLRQPAVPSLYQWLVKYKGLLVSKFTLYFYETLSKQGPTSEVKGIAAKTTVDFYGKIVTFQKKSDATNVSVVFDTNGIEDIHKGPGYHHPDKFTEPPKGIDSYPAIFSYPAERPEKHWPSIISIMNDRLLELSTLDKTVYFCDEKFQSTYFLSRIEPRVTLVATFETKKSEKDSYINNVINEISMQLRCVKLFAALKPGTKG